MPDPTLSEIVDRAIDQDSRRYEKLLTATYVDPGAARHAFATRADAVGAQKAGREMAANPAAYGAVRTDVEPIRASVAREMGFVAAITHHLQQERDPAAIAGLMRERFFQGACTVFEDAGTMFQRWQKAVEAHGPAVTAQRLTSEPESFGALRPGAAAYTRTLASRGLDAELARAHSIEAPPQESPHPASRRPHLPRTVNELVNRPGGRLPRALEMRFEALTADFRGMLTAAYLDPRQAESAFHELVGREGIQATVLAVRRQPAVLGELSSSAGAADDAYGAAKRGARAYELHAIANPSQGAEVLRRETERSLARQVTNPDAALQVIQAAMRRFGIEQVAEEILREPARYFTARDGQPLNPASLAADARALGEANRSADEYVAAASAPVPDRGHEQAAAAATVQKHADATLLSEKKGDLHETLNDAANAARRAEDALKWHDIYQTQLRRTLGRIYANPAAAEVAFVRIADERGMATAIEQLTKKPHKLGALAPNKSAARTAARSAGAVASSYLTAREQVAKVEWRDREGTTHQGAEAVRAAATAEIKGSAAELTDTEGRLRELGGLHGTKARAVEAVQRLSPEQADELIALLSDRNPHAAEQLRGVRDSAADRRDALLSPGTAQTVMQTAQMVRSMGEGPTM